MTEFMFLSLLFLMVMMLQLSGLCVVTDEKESLIVEKTMFLSGLVGLALALADAYMAM